MSWPTDTLAGVYLFLFAFGLIFSALSLAIGAIGGHFHLPGSAHVGHSGHLGAHGHGDGHAAAGHGPTAGHIGGVHDIQGAAPAAPTALNVSTLMIFLTWFGATGYILRTFYSSLAVVSLLAATALGLVGATLVWAFLAKVLWRGQTQLDPLNYQIEGVVGEVTAPIRAGGTGEIVYRLDGKRRVDGARSRDGAAIPVGTEVAILRYDAGIAYVTAIDAALTEEFPATAPEEIATFR